MINSTNKFSIETQKKRMNRAQDHRVESFTSGKELGA
jgi:hypothetical protein